MKNSKVMSNNNLVYDKDFIPHPVDNGDEIFPNGIFEFNITKMLEEIQKNPDQYVLEDVEVESFPWSFSVINEAHMEVVEIGKPVILAEIAPGKFNLIDGNHRMEKARRTGIQSLTAYKLNVRQHIRFLTSEEAYKAYIDYWNEKLEEK